MQHHIDTTKINDSLQLGFHDIRLPSTQADLALVEREMHERLVTPFHRIMFRHHKLKLSFSALTASANHPQICTPSTTHSAMLIFSD